MDDTELAREEAETMENECVAMMTDLIINHGYVEADLQAMMDDAVKGSRG